MIQRVQQGTRSTITATVQVDGTATDPAPDTATIHVVRADGTDLVAAGTATVNSGTGEFSYTLTAAQTALLDRLTARWTFTLGSESQTLDTFVEVVGGFLFPLATAKADADLSSQTAAALAVVRTRAEEALERACGVAFVPRFARETVSGDASNDLLLQWPRLRSVRSATVDGTALTPTELGQLAVSSLGSYWPDQTWGKGVSNIVVGYEHGHDFPPGPVSNAALLLAKSYIVSSPFNDPRVVMAQAGQEQFQFTRSGGGGFGIPEVDQVVRDYGYVLGVV